MPAGTRHAYRNASAATAHMVCEATPPLELEEFLTDVAALAGSGSFTRRGLPTSPTAAPELAGARAALPRDRRARDAAAPADRRCWRGSAARARPATAPPSGDRRPARAGPPAWSTAQNAIASAAPTKMCAIASSCSASGSRSSPAARAAAGRSGPTARRGSRAAASLKRPPSPNSTGHVARCSSANVRNASMPARSARSGSSALPHGAADLLEQPPAGALDAGQEQPLLGAEVVVQHRLGDAGGGGDLVHRDAVVAALGEQPLGGGDHLRLAHGARRAAARIRSLCVVSLIGVTERVYPG